MRDVIRCTPHAVLGAAVVLVAVLAGITIHLGGAVFVPAALYGIAP
jgi:hypothetical protein